MIERSFFERNALACAKELIGTEFRFRSCSGLVIETEAYAEHGDEACHLFTRPSARAFADNHPPGTAYVYLNYGVHWLFNVLCRDTATGEAGFVLFRALQPLSGVEAMQKRRCSLDRLNLCSGPGKLSQAFGIDHSLHGASVVESDDLRFKQARQANGKILADKRVGISSAKEHLWRFLSADTEGVSVPFGKVK